ncbi:multidrug efflux SMR transporter [Gracilibacillus caseinilyticus]|uniref:Multidrug efflux SMR transporter n=1 Tax=Gracilibacillus caseinilyticus TaxID=2932256 RepID=A0ABY4ES09_9BACI|nr:multidrug efflux SMR transporter [Gracilibacillus caseinilyticus]UOQ46668.1 multidrug efflux SMR transporter [Gracilibacillus caseinilyticus]
MAWVTLIAAGLLEMIAVIGLNQWHKTKSKLSFFAMIFCFISSFFFLYLALKTIPMGVGYAVWTGIGAAGGALVGMIWYKESANFKRIFFLVLIIVAVIGLKLVG